MHGPATIVLVACAIVTFCGIEICQIGILCKSVTNRQMGVQTEDYVDFKVSCTRARTRHAINNF